VNCILLFIVLQTFQLETPVQQTRSTTGPGQTTGAVDYQYENNLAELPALNLIVGYFYVAMLPAGLCNDKEGTRLWQPNHAARPETGAGSYHG
jgi:hypothetical protein